MIRGSCLCGAVSWQYDGGFELITHCHCGRCRKAHAAPFATYAMGPSKPFSLLTGADDITAYRSAAPFVRGFCRHCGSVTPNLDLGERIAIPVGTFDDDPGLAPSAHIFARSKAPWHVISDTLPQYEYYPDGNAPALAEPALPAPAAGVLRGSCLCGEVAYAMEGGFVAVHNCHCSRCRKARAAAHTTNGFTSLDKLRYTRGGESVKTYRVPAARYFSQTFCQRCGSGLPRLDPERQIAVVPFGSLDDDPGRGADDHIFVASKSSWYPITDDLPRFEAQAG